MDIKFASMKSGDDAVLDVIKRGFDVGLAVCLSVAFGLLMICIWGVIRLTSEGRGIYWSDRIGKNNVIFKMPKFRTMKEGAPAVATHLLGNPESWVTPIGRLLRKLSLDELPQLYSVIKGDMSFVGPRPALFNQDDLVACRTIRGVHRLVPGITGWAQINGRDELPIPVKVVYDEYYLHNRTFLFDMHILAMTIGRVLKRSGVSH